jgi:tetraacyldisaccharide 4'-kinase
MLFPFALIYRIIIRVRNLLYDANILKSSDFNFPIICIGNVAVGGTGKTPMTEYLIELLQGQHQVATLSRGYKRRTKGFAIAGSQTTAIEIGDEPMQFHQKFPNVTVAVGEERLVAIPQILYQHPNTSVILLDDAFQHRAVRAGLNILLTEYSNLYTRDFMMPSGDLRDERKSSKRAHVIIVTKCPENLSQVEKSKLVSELNPLPNQQVYFTTIQYGTPYHLFTGNKLKIENAHNVLLLCGIANPMPVKKYLNEHVHSFEMLKFKDHHIFNSSDLKEIQKQFHRNTAEQKIIITTEKDAVRLSKFKNEMTDLPIYVLPVKHHFLFNESDHFNKQVLGFIDSYKKKD